MNWSPDQQRLLGAMGYQLLVRVDPSMAPGGSTDASVAASAAPRTTTASAAPPAATAAVPPAASLHGSQAMFTALRAALTRAAGGADIAALIADLDGLRRQPSAKRALWPRLRALRRTS